jgi:hypothetical protein
VADPITGVHVFAEADCCYGVGSVTMRIEHVDRANPVNYDGANWYQVVGMQLNHNGTERGHRSLLVRVTRLPTARRP